MEGQQVSDLVNVEKTGHYIDREGLGEEPIPGEQKQEGEGQGQEQAEQRQQAAGQHNPIPPEESPVKGEQTGHYLDRARTGEEPTPKGKRQDADQEQPQHNHHQGGPTSRRQQQPQQDDQDNQQHHHHQPHWQAEGGAVSCNTSNSSK